MELITILNRCHHFRGFVYQHARFSADHNSIEISVRARKGSAAICSRCHQTVPGHDQLAERRFEFIPFWVFFVFLLYAMRRVNCRRCGTVVVEEVPWGDGKRTLTKAYMLFLASWARRLSWKETAGAFRTSWKRSSTRWNTSSPSGWSTSSRLRFADLLRWWCSFRLRSTGKAKSASPSPGPVVAVIKTGNNAGVLFRH